MECHRFGNERRPVKQGLILVRSWNRGKADQFSTDTDIVWVLSFGVSALTLRPASTSISGDNLLLPLKPAGVLIFPGGMT